MYHLLLIDQLGRALSLSEAASLALEARAVGLDRATAGAEMVRTPTASLGRIRKRRSFHYTLSAAEWDALAEY